MATYQMTHIWEEIDDAVTSFLGKDTAAELEVLLADSFEPKKGTDDNYVTDAEKTVIGNTSGTNTGDQSAADVAVADSGDVFTGENVEAVLAELKTDLDLKSPTIQYGYENIPIGWFADGSSPPDAIDYDTRPPFSYRTFAHDADEDLNTVWFVPSNMSATTTTIQFRVKYLVTAATGPTASEGVAFGLSGVSAGDNDASNFTKGSVVVVQDDALNATQWDFLITPWSDDVTVSGIAPGEIAELALIRDVSDAVDDYAQLVGVVAVEIRYVLEVSAP